jgi:hypothetical protein
MLQLFGSSRFELAVERRTLRLVDSPVESYLTVMENTLGLATIAGPSTMPLECWPTLRAALCGQLSQHTATADGSLIFRQEHRLVNGRRVSGAAS